MAWKDCIDSGDARKTEMSHNLAKARKSMADKKVIFLKGNSINEENGFILFPIAYDVLLETLHAVCATKGYKIYGHACITDFIREVLHDNQLAEKFDSYRKTRNGIIYYGNLIDAAYAKSSIEDIFSLVSKLKHRYLEVLK